MAVELTLVDQSSLLRLPRAIRFLKFLQVRLALLRRDSREFLIETLALDYTREQLANVPLLIIVSVSAALPCDTVGSHASKGTGPM